MSVQILEINLETLTMKGWYDQERKMIPFTKKFENAEDFVKELELFADFVKTVKGLQPYEEAMFSADEGLYVYKGYHNGQTWNGFATPCFEFNEAKQVIEDACDQFATSYINLGYDEDTDTFRFKDGADNEVYEYQGVDIEVNGKTVHVYDICSGYWCWDTVSEEDIDNENE